MNILITGGAGGIGSTLCIELAKNGHTVVALDDFSIIINHNSARMIRFHD